MREDAGIALLDLPAIREIVSVVTLLRALVFVRAVAGVVIFEEGTARFLRARPSEASPTTLRPLSYCAW